MAKYDVSFRVDAQFKVTVDADSVEEAKKVANQSFFDADFGVAEDIDGDIVNILDEEGNFIYEK